LVEAEAHIALITLVYDEFAENARRKCTDGQTVICQTPRDVGDHGVFARQHIAVVDGVDGAVEMRVAVDPDTGVGG